MAEQFAQILHDLRALVEALPRRHPLGYDFRIGEEEPSGPKGPQVDVKDVAEVVLFLDVAAPRMGVRFGRKMLLTVGGDRKVPQQKRRPGW
jgi:hypothetical protein